MKSTNIGGKKVYRDFWVLQEQKKIAKKGNLQGLILYFAYKFRIRSYSGRVGRYRPHVPALFPLLKTEAMHNPPSSESIPGSTLKRNINSKSNSPKP